MAQVRLQDQILQAVQAQVEALAPVAGHAAVRIEPTRNSEAEPEPIAVDTRSAMRMLGLGRSSILALADSGELPRVRFGRRVVYSTADLERLVEKRRRQAGRHPRQASTGSRRLTERSSSQRRLGRAQDRAPARRAASCRAFHSSQQSRASSTSGALRFLRHGCARHYQSGCHFHSSPAPQSPV